MPRKGWPPEFRRKALDLVASGRNVREVAATLGIAESCLHRWCSRDLLERGLKTPSAAVVGSAALAAADQRIQEPENEVKILRKAAAAVEEAAPPKRRFELVTELAGEGVPVKQTCLAPSPFRAITTPGPGRPRRGRSGRHGSPT